MVARMTATDARKGYRTLEPLHAFIYFSTDAARRYAELGLTHGRTQYFASRGAAFGRCGPGPVIATFYNFAPAQVVRALPAAWEAASPEQVLAARHGAAQAFLAEVTTGAEPQVAEAITLLERMTAALDPTGRPLFAAHADLDWPDDPTLRLWHLLTLLREWRGDGHVAVLTAEGVRGCEVLHIHAAAGGPPAQVLRVTRGWTEDDWAAAADRLVAAGTLTPLGTLTPAGAAHRQHVEDRTDALGAAPWQLLGAEDSSRLRELLRPFAKAIVQGGGMGAMAPAAGGR